MKKIIISFAFLASIAACNETKKVNTPEPETTAPTAPVAEPQKQMVTVSGKVEDIVSGKDGYTAKIISTDGNTYFITASIPNSTDPKNYRRVAVGETVRR
jgi:ABC-type Fe3+-hydroxamate transport system substrate-binding protein